jgi:hypothetical protein
LARCHTVELYDAYWEVALRRSISSIQGVIRARAEKELQLKRGFPYIGDVRATLSPEERSMLGLMDPKDRAYYLLQKKMQERADMAELLSKLQALRHQTAMETIKNVR